MTEDPYRWLEAIANRREYVRTQLEGGSPVFAASLPEGILLFAVGTGQTKVFEVFDRQALAGLGHPADLERLRQSLIDAAHLEGFARAAEDVSLRRLVGQGLGPQLKIAFEQIHAPPFLARLLLAEVAPETGRDLLVKLGFDGTYSFRLGGVAVVADKPELEATSEARLAERLGTTPSLAAAAEAMLEEWTRLVGTPAPTHPDTPTPAEAATKHRPGTGSGLGVEAGLLRRMGPSPSRFRSLDAAALGLALSARVTP